MSKRTRPARPLEQPAEEPPQPEPGTVYISPEGNICYNEKDLRAKPKVTVPNVITDEYVKAALEVYPEVHPGWKYLFTRSRELADELRRRKAAGAAREGQTITSDPQPAEAPAEAL